MDSNREFYQDGNRFTSDDDLGPVLTWKKESIAEAVKVLEKKKSSSFQLQILIDEGLGNSKLNSQTYKQFGIDCLSIKTEKVLQSMWIETVLTSLRYNFMNQSFNSW